MQPVDAITLVAICWELTQDWLPARVEQVVQRDRFTVAIGLRTLNQRGWLTLSWHPQAARLCIAEAPPRTPDTFTLSQQLKHQLNGLALIQVAPLTPWERVVDLQFAQRPGEDPLWHLYLEVMGQYSNLILTNADNAIVTAARQVSHQQSSLREIQTGDGYTPPPRLMGRKPALSDSQQTWQEQISLIPGTLGKTLLKCYQGLSTAVVQGLLTQVGLPLETLTTSLQVKDWEALFQVWQATLQTISICDFQPSRTANGYTVLPGQGSPTGSTIQALIAEYYRQHLDQQVFQQLHHQLQQKVNQQLNKLKHKIDLFQARLQASDRAEQFREQADLLMAYLHEWQTGLTEIILKDFASNCPVRIALNPEKNAVQNAQALYKQHQKLKRSREAVEPLLQTTQQELHYLAQVEITLQQLASDRLTNNLPALQEVRDELIQQGYLEDPYAQRFRPGAEDPSHPYRYQSPSGFEVWVGRNNRQNDWLTFRVAGDYDLWFHTQEIPGSHVLLRLKPGAVPDEIDLQFTADLAAYYSRGRQSEQVPVVFTEPRYVFKPKGTRPGMVVYQQERIQWGHPFQVADLASTQEFV